MNAVSGVACTWLQDDLNNSVEPQFFYWYGSRYCAAFHDTAVLTALASATCPPGIHNNDILLS